MSPRAGDHGDAAQPTPSRNPLVRFQRGFEERFERLRAGYHELLALAIEHRALFVGGFLGFIVVSFLLAPFLGRNFFPQVDGGQMLLHVRAPVGMRIEETAARFAEVEKAIREVIPPAEVAAIVDNIGTYLSSINTIYNNTGTIGESDGDIQISLNAGACADRRLRQSPAQRAAAALSRHDILVSAGRYRQPDPEFRRAGADRSAGARQRSRRGFRLRQQAAGADPPRHRGRRCAHPAVGRAADARCQHRPHARRNTPV